MLLANSQTASILQSQEWIVDLFPRTTTCLGPVAPWSDDIHGTGSERRRTLDWLKEQTDLFGFDRSAVMESFNPIIGSSS